MYDTIFKLVLLPAGLVQFVVEKQKDLAYQLCYVFTENQAED